MTLELLKFLVAPVLLERDENGNITGERAPDQPRAIYGFDGLRAYVDELERDIAKENVN